MEPSKTFCQNELFSPVLVIDAKGRLVERNEMARRVLPSLPALKGFLKQHRDVLVPPSLHVLPIRGEYYRIAVFSRGEERVLWFLTDLLECSVPFSQFLFWESDEILDRLQGFFALSQTEKDSAVPESAQSIRKILGRSVRYREEARAYLRFLNHRRLGEERPGLCDLGHFFINLQNSLEETSVRIRVMGAQGVTVFASPGDLSRTVPELIRFAYLISPDTPVEITVFPEEERVRISFSFSDPERYFGRIKGWFEADRKTETPEEFAGGASLFSVLSLCGRNGVSFTLFGGEENGKMELVFPGKREDPEYFLEAETSEEVLLLRKLCRAIFFSAEK